MKVKIFKEEMGGSTYYYIGDERKQDNSNKEFEERWNEFFEREIKHKKVIDVKFSAFCSGVSASPHYGVVLVLYDE